MLLRGAPPWRSESVKAKGELHRTRAAAAFDVAFRGAPNPSSYRGTPQDARRRGVPRGVSQRSESVKLRGSES